MANIVITSTAHTVKVIFNIYAANAGFDSVNFRRDEISEVKKTFGSDHITIIMLDTEEFEVTYNTGHEFAMKVDSIDGIVPTDNDHLALMLEAFQQL